MILSYYRFFSPSHIIINSGSRRFHPIGRNLNYYNYFQKCFSEIVSYSRRWSQGRWGKQWKWCPVHTTDIRNTSHASTNQQRGLFCELPCGWLTQQSPTSETSRKNHPRMSWIQILPWKLLIFRREKVEFKWANVSQAWAFSSKLITSAQ